MGEMTDEQRHGFSRIAAEAATVEGLLTHPGMAIVKAAVERQEEFNMKKWFTAPDPIEAEKIRIKMRGYYDFFRFCEVIIKNGENARLKLASDFTPSADEAEQGV